MGTRSSIAIENPDGTVESVYCHWDGYLEHNGEILLEHYNDEKKIRELLSYGNISSLGEKIGEKHDFNSVKDGITTFYHRDREETGQERAKHPSVDEWLSTDGQAYNYLFTMKGKWFVQCSDDGFVDLDRAIGKKLTGFDPVEDEKKLFSMKEWIATLKSELDRYEKEWTDKPNEYHKKEHTWTEWMGTFGRYMSW